MAIYRRTRVDLAKPLRRARKRVTAKIPAPPKGWSVIQEIRAFPDGICRWGTRSRLSSNSFHWDVVVPYRSDTLRIKLFDKKRQKEKKSLLGSIRVQNLFLRCHRRELAHCRLSCVPRSAVDQSREADEIEPKICLGGMPLTVSR